MAGNASLLNIQGVKDYDKLNNFFGDNSYYQNNMLSVMDLKIYKQITNVICKDKYPHLYRWYKHISRIPDHVFDELNKNNEKDNKGKTAAKKTEEEEVDDDIDLFGDTNEDDKQLLDKKKKELEDKKKKEAKEKEKNRSILIIEIKPKTITTDINKIEKLIRQKIVDPHIKWGEEVKTLPIAFGLQKLQMSCIIYDDFVNTNELIENIENIDLESEEDKKKRKLILGCDEDYDEDNDEQQEQEEVEDDLDFLVQSAEIVTFNKL